MTTPFRIVDSVGTVMSEHSTRLACAEAWNGLGHGIEAQELVFGEWSAVPVEELESALRGARLRHAGITPQFPGLINSTERNHQTESTHVAGGEPQPKDSVCEVWVEPDGEPYGRWQWTTDRAVTHHEACLYCDEEQRAGNQARVLIIGEDS